jgi:hypothetical protein
MRDRGKKFLRFEPLSFLKTHLNQNQANEYECNTQRNHLFILGKQPIFSYTKFPVKK